MGDPFASSPYENRQEVDQCQLSPPIKHCDSGCAYILSPILAGRPRNSSTFEGCKPVTQSTFRRQRGTDVTFNRNIHRAIVGKAPQSVARRNARERRRVQAVNFAFARLRKVLPTYSQKCKRISKVKTLRLAINHIDNLSRILNASNASAEQYSHSDSHSKSCGKAPLLPEYRRYASTSVNHELVKAFRCCGTSSASSESLFQDVMIESKFHTVDECDLRYGTGSFTNTTTVSSEQ
ncbi:protein Fer3-like [Paramacrobiotus metropolitanus]|uniref:protein Fer3-like n=1 Tax=Paramacrobiotus metropolitanus TaxID=2943436 RepID=UPI002445D44D|nr:protein Fer3-like [Paramacrobiotus metropolitanus]